MKKHPKLFLNKIIFLCKSLFSYQSTLYADDYTILEVQTCKQLIRKLKPSLYQIQNENETICYSKTKPFNINGQSGAPSIHRNHLVSVAAGEILSDKEHIIIGTKISCFCNWIIENLPSGGDHVICCKDCCNILDKQLNQTFMFLK
ncbi:unnamed protein product [Parnassius mnemosyne]|uniref:Uncharacterized protein n=1 Tax=Parnassius mnemosyne TaxID=213953 RepID=A0AAV1KBL1_9NEOP